MSILLSLYYKIIDYFKLKEDKTQKEHPRFSLGYTRINFTLDRDGEVSPPLSVIPRHFFHCDQHLPLIEGIFISFYYEKGNLESFMVLDTVNQEYTRGSVKRRFVNIPTIPNKIDLKEPCYVRGLLFVDQKSFTKDYGEIDPMSHITYFFQDIKRYLSHSYFIPTEILTYGENNRLYPEGVLTTPDQDSFITDLGFYLPLFQKRSLYDEDPYNVTSLQSTLDQQERTLKLSLISRDKIIRDIDVLTSGVLWYKDKDPILNNPDIFITTTIPQHFIVDVLSVDETVNQFNSYHVKVNTSPITLGSHTVTNFILPNTFLKTRSFKQHSKLMVGFDEHWKNRDAIQIRFYPIQIIDGQHISQIPKDCPFCGNPFILKEYQDDLSVMCSNYDCRSAATDRLAHVLRLFNITLSNDTILDLYDHGIHDIADYLAINKYNTYVVEKYPEVYESATGLTSLSMTSYVYMVLYHLLYHKATPKLSQSISTIIHHDLSQFQDLQQDDWVSSGIEPSLVEKIYPNDELYLGSVSHLIDKLIFLQQEGIIRVKDDTSDKAL